MHTFFINTSSKKLDEYDIVFDIHCENRKLVSFDCPLSSWNDAEKGYQSCVKKMSTLIDEFVELDNNFNLIIYIDLFDFTPYRLIERDFYNEKKRETYLFVLKTLYTHLINDTIAKSLVKLVREPRSILIMLGVDKQKKLEDVAVAEPTEKDIQETFIEFLGVPNEEAIKNIAYSIKDGDFEENARIFKEHLDEIWEENEICWVRSCYEYEFLAWTRRILAEKESIADANAELVRGIKKHTDHSTVYPQLLPCPYDFYSDGNKHILALNQLNVLFHIIKCVEANSIYESEKDDEGRRILRKFRSYTPDEICAQLKMKEKLFADEIKKINSESLTYAEQKLAPELFSFDYEKFGLDEHGDKATDFIITHHSASEKSDSEKSSENPPEIDGTTDKVSVVEATGGSLLSDEEYPLFEYSADLKDDDVTLDTQPEKHIEFALRVKRMHLDYLKKLKEHLSTRLSNYAGKSKGNNTATLQLGKYRYTNNAPDDRPLEAVEQFAKKAYETTLDRYMEFCAARGVSMSDITKECDLFISRINQITATLNKIKLIRTCLFISLFVLYLPFFIVQFDVLAKSTTTLITTLISFGVPVFISYLLFLFATNRQKRKYLDERDKFKSESDRIISGNMDVASKYDQLLTVAIPSLRWVYEYMLDVEYCGDCCRIADAKRTHHKNKLHDRIAAIGNILGDLECNSPACALPKAAKNLEVDYNLPFCCGEKNISFYSITNSEFFKSEGKEE